MKSFTLSRVYFNIILLALSLLILSCDSTEKDWEKTRAANTIKSYEEFITAHPKGMHVNEAYTTLELMEYNKTQKDGSIEAYKKFLEKYPEGAHYDEARRTFEMMEWTLQWTEPKTPGSGETDKIRLKPIETVLCDYREKEQGGFSQKWAAYILSEGEGDDKKWYIELNGNKIGPFINFGDLMSFSPNGEKIVFGAKEKESKKWDVYVNGTKKWSYDGLCWARYSWPANLEGTLLRSQTKSIAFKQSYDNKTVSFFASRKEGDNTLWANVINGVEANYYNDINTNIEFIDGQPAYWAWKGDNEKYFVMGDKEYGPYNKANSIKVSDDKKHFMFVAENEGKYFLILDGKKIEIPGDIKNYAIGDEGIYAVSSVQDGAVHVMQNGVEWPKTYSDTVWHQFIFSPDGKNLAGWFKHDGNWYVVINGEKEYGPYESYFFYRAGEFYSIFMGKSGENIGYFVRLIEGTSTGGEFYLNGEKAENEPEFGGFFTSYYPDDSGNVVGMGGGSGVELDMPAVADATALGADNPSKAKYLGSRLIYSKKKEDLIYVVSDQKESGPYTNVEKFCSSPDGNHFAYIAENKDGKFVVVDEKYQTPIYQSIYRLQFPADDELAFLTVKDGKIVRIFTKF